MGILQPTSDVVPFPVVAQRMLVVAGVAGKKTYGNQVEAQARPRELLLALLAPPLIPHEAERTAKALRQGGDPFEDFAVLQSIAVKHVRRP